MFRTEGYMSDIQISSRPSPLLWTCTSMPTSKSAKPANNTSLPLYVIIRESCVLRSSSRKAGSLIVDLRAATFPLPVIEYTSQRI